MNCLSIGTEDTARRSQKKKPQKINSVTPDTWLHVMLVTDQKKK